MALGQLLPDQAVGVLARAPFPGMMRSGKVEAHSGGRFDESVAVKLGPVVEGDRLEPPRMPVDQSDDDPDGVLFGAAGEFANQHVAGLSLHQGDHTVTLLALSHHRIDLPVTNSVPPLHGSRPLLDHPLPGQSPSGVIASIAFATLLERLTQVGVQRASSSHVAPDVAVDGFVADGEPTCATQVPADLLRAPLLLEQCLNCGELIRAEVAVAPGTFASGNRPFVRPSRTVIPVVGSGVAPGLPPDGGAISAQLIGNLRMAPAVAAESGDQNAFLRREVVNVIEPSLRPMFPPNQPRLPSSSFFQEALHLLFESKNLPIEGDVTKVLHFEGPNRYWIPVGIQQRQRVFRPTAQ